MKRCELNWGCPPVPEAIIPMYLALRGGSKVCRILSCRMTSGDGWIRKGRLGQVGEAPERSCYLVPYRILVPCRSESSISEALSSAGNRTPEILQALMLAPSSLALLKSTPRKSDCRK